MVFVGLAIRLAIDVKSYRQRRSVAAIQRVFLNCPSSVRYLRIVILAEVGIMDRAVVHSFELVGGGAISRVRGVIGVGDVVVLGNIDEVQTSEVVKSLEDRNLDRAEVLLLRLRDWWVQDEGYRCAGSCETVRFGRICFLNLQLGLNQCNNAQGCVEGSQNTPHSVQFLPWYY